MKKRLAILIVALSVLSAFNSQKKKKLRLPDEYSFIPGGTIWIASSQEDVMTEKAPERITVPSFYISKFEISNLQYGTFLKAIDGTISKAEYDSLIPDSSGWWMTLSFGEPIITRYFRHPAFSQFPVVNISYESALRYCHWLQQKIQQDNPDFSIAVSLPSKTQWTRAAKGLHFYTIYPWGYSALIDKGGRFLCNFRHIEESEVVRNIVTGRPEFKKGSYSQQTSGSYFFTSPVKSFDPNDFQLYNMSGNVAEMINEKGTCMGGSWNDYGGEVTITSVAKYETSSPYTGFRPVITVTKKKEE